MANESLYLCDDCDQRFGHLSTLQAHMSRAHPNTPDIEIVKKPLKCQFCNEDFAEDFLQTHEEYCDVVTGNVASKETKADQVENNSEIEQRMEEPVDVEVIECSTDSDKNTNDVEIVEITKEQNKKATEKSSVDNHEVLESNVQFVEVTDELDSGFNADDNDEFEIVLDDEEDPFAETNNSEDTLEDTKEKITKRSPIKKDEKKKSRTTVSKIQTRMLKSIFQYLKHPSKDEYALIAKRVGLELKVIRHWFYNHRRLEKYLERTGNEENLKTEVITECPFCKVPFNGLDDKDHYQNCLKEPKINAELSTKSGIQNTAQNNLAQIPFPVSSTPLIIPEENTTKCTMCQKMFKNSLNLEEHIRGIHLREKTQICDLCSLAFDSKQERNKHIEVSHGSDSEPVTSVTENQKDSSKPDQGNKESIVTNLTGNENAATQNNLAQVPFPVSSTPEIIPEEKSSDNNSDFSKQNVTEIQELPKNAFRKKTKHSCDKCSYLAQSRRDLNDHFKTSDYKLKKIYPCDQCNFKSCTKFGLAKHNKKGIHKLPSNTSNLESIDLSVSKSEKSEYIDTSNEKFDSPVINSTMEVEKNVEVSSDVNSEISKQSLESTVTNVVETPKKESNVKSKYFCQRCSYETKSNSQLKDHFKTVEYKMNMNKKHSCDKCDFTSCTKAGLAIHIRKAIHVTTTTNFQKSPIERFHEKTVEEIQNISKRQKIDNENKGNTNAPNEILAQVSVQTDNQVKSIDIIEVTEKNPEEIENQANPSEKNEEKTTKNQPVDTKQLGTEIQKQVVVENPSKIPEIVKTSKNQQAENLPNLINEKSILICLVCGDEVKDEKVGGIQACEDCHKFFNRTVELKKKYHCVDKKSCQVTLASRSRCFYCRYKKMQNLKNQKSSKKIVVNRDLPPKITKEKPQQSKDMKNISQIGEQFQEVKSEKNKISDSRKQKNTEIKRSDVFSDESDDDDTTAENDKENQGVGKYLDQLGQQSKKEKTEKNKISDLNSKVLNSNKNAVDIDGNLGNDDKDSSKFEKISSECYICNMRFKNPSNLKVHMESHIPRGVNNKLHLLRNALKKGEQEIKRKNQNEETVCQIKSSYKQFHEKTVEEEIPQKQDDKKQESNSSPDSKNNNTTAVTENLKFECEICRKSFKFQIGLNKHLKMHKEESESPKIVDVQNVHEESTQNQNSNENNLKRKVSNQEVDDSVNQSKKIKLTQENSIDEGHKNENKCDICGRYFSRADYLRIHIRNVHEGHKDYQCDPCGNTYSELGQLKRHQTKMHNIQKVFKWSKNLACQACINIFKKKLKIEVAKEDKMHGNHDNGSMKKIEKVNVASKDESIMNDSNEQIDITTDKSLEAEGFDDISADPKNYDRSIHDFECDPCGKTFSDVANLRRHIKDVHEGRKDLNCDTCRKSFADKRNLTNHIRNVHEGHKDFKCNICDEIFFEYGGVKGHQIRKHSIKKDFKWSKNLDCEACILKKKISKREESSKEDKVMENDNIKISDKSNMDHDSNDKDETTSENDQKNEEIDTQCYYCYVMIAQSEIQKHMTDYHKSEYQVEMHGPRKQKNTENKKLDMNYFSDESDDDHDTTAENDKENQDDGIYFEKMHYPTKQNINVENKDIQKEVDYSTDSNTKKPFKKNDETKIQKNSDENKVSKDVPGDEKSNENNKCYSCGNTLSSKSILKKHIATVHEGQKKYKCDSCGRLFSQATNLNRHIASVHDVRKDFNCLVLSCDKTFTKLQHLNNHFIESHHNSKNNGSKEASMEMETKIKVEKFNDSKETCAKNEEDNTTTSNISNQIPISDESNAKTSNSFKCDSCDQTFAISNNLKLHIHAFHEDNKDFKCDSCSKSFSSSKSMERHTRTIHEGHKDFVCDICDESFAQSHHLKRHVNKAHGQISMNETMETKVKLEKEFPDQEENTNLKITEENMDEKPNSNENATNTQIENNIVENFVKSNTIGPDKNWEIHRCELCPRTFHLKSALKIHTVKKHKKNFKNENKNEDTYGHEYFFKDLIWNSFLQSSTSSNNLRQIKTPSKRLHDKITEEIQSDSKRQKSENVESDDTTPSPKSSNPLKNKSMKCEFCEKSFIIKSKMNMHMKKAHKNVEESLSDQSRGSDPVQIELESSSNRIVTKEKIHVCDQCNIAFDSVKELNRHADIFHKTYF